LDIFTADDGPKTSVVSKEKAEVWFKMKHFHLVLSDKPTRERLFGALVAMRASFDPKLAFEQLQADQKAGNVEVETRGPMKKGQPITLTVTSKKTPDKKELYHVDPQTKLVERVFELHRKGDRWQVTQMREYLDYNKEFDPGVFQLGAPQGTVTIDQIKNKVGLDQGALTDEEIAKKVAKEFFEAVIAGEYQKASPLLSGLPAEQVKKIFEPPQVKLLRIVEIGKPTPHSYTRSLKVPVKVEVEVNGEKLIKEFSPFVRQEAGGWTIIGGL
jgi:hypothetical protein